MICSTNWTFVTDLDGVRNPWALNPCVGCHRRAVCHRRVVGGHRVCDGHRPVYNRGGLINQAQVDFQVQTAHHFLSGAPYLHLGKGFESGGED